MARRALAFLRMAHGAMRSGVERLPRSAPRNAGLASGIAYEFVGADLLRSATEESRRQCADNRMRQRVISRGRHVAPALLLC
jgi:hypothetical protein